MKFRTEIEPLKKQGTIGHDTPLIMIGSCFTDEIGSRMYRRMFDVSVNPFGTLYNPESIASAIEAALDGKIYDRSDLFFHEGRYHTFNRHSDFSGYEPGPTLEALNDSLVKTRHRLSRCQVMILTFGSAMAFRHKTSGEIVANCHKLPASEFSLEELSVQQITGRMGSVIEKMRLTNPELKLIVTVSPVRHAGYGLTTDRLSKSRLLLACARLSESMDNIIYFPSYEIMVDDLRDYRFYASDLVHPSDMAVEYIYDLFSRSFMDDPTRSTASRWKKLTDRASHRFAAGDRQAEAFREETIRLAGQLSKETESPETFNRFKDFLSKCKQQ